MISIIDQVRDAIKAAGMSSDQQFKFPQFVVIGDQSSGKSSLIEGIVGHHFLPRGSGFVTRRPVVLRLVNVPLNDQRRSHNDVGQNVWMEFAHRHGIFTDFEDVHDEIVKEFEKVNGPNISEEEIILTIYSHKVVDISMVDLPGIIRLHLEGQDKTLRSRIENLVRSYIKKENTLILAVSAANNDIQNSGALSSAKEVDPNGDRTLCLFTKLDNMPRGESAHDRLRGVGVKAKLGVIGVINRSQEGVNNKQTIDECLEHEATFFTENLSEFSNTGVPFLTKSLNKILKNRILQSLPSVEKALSKSIVDVKFELDKYLDKEINKTSKLVGILDEFKEEIKEDITGGRKRIQTQNESCGARIHKILHEKLRDRLLDIKPLESLTEKELRIAHENTRGYKTELIVGSDGFRVLLCKYIGLLEKPCLEIANDVHAEMRKAMLECNYLNEQNGKFPSLVDEVNSLTDLYLHRRLEPTLEFVSHTVQSECDDINFKNADFTASRNQIVKSVLDLQSVYNAEKRKRTSNWFSRRTKTVSDNNDVTTEFDLILIGEQIGIYFDIVRKKLIHDIPKIIAKFLIEDFFDGKHGIGRHLVTDLVNKADDLLRENENIKAVKEKLQNKLQTLKSAQMAIVDIKRNENCD